MFKCDEMWSWQYSKVNGDDIFLLYDIKKRP